MRRCLMHVIFMVTGMRVRGLGGDSLEKGVFAVGSEVDFCYDTQHNRPLLYV